MESINDVELVHVVTTLSQLVRSHVDSLVSGGATIQAAQEHVLLRLIGNDRDTTIEPSEDELLNLMSSGYLRRSEAVRAWDILRHLQNLALTSSSVHCCVETLKSRLENVSSESLPQIEVAAPPAVIASVPAASSGDNIVGKCSSRRLPAKRKSGSLAKKGPMLENKERLSKLLKFSPSTVGLSSSDNNVDQKKKRRRTKKGDRLHNPT
jgi:hypothetical protein